TRVVTVTNVAKPVDLDNPDGPKPFAPVYEVADSEREAQVILLRGRPAGHRTGPKTLKRGFTRRQACHMAGQHRDDPPVWQAAEEWLVVRQELAEQLPAQVGDEHDERHGDVVRL